jgi:hypothetical protein
VAFQRQWSLPMGRNGRARSLQHIGGKRKVRLRGIGQWVVMDEVHRRGMVAVVATPNPPLPTALRRSGMDNTHPRKERVTPARFILEGIARKRKGGKWAHRRLLIVGRREGGGLVQHGQVEGRKGGRPWHDAQAGGPDRRHRQWSDGVGQRACTKRHGAGEPDTNRWVLAINDKRED